MSLSTTPGSPYTWATATWSWVDARAGKTWATAYPVAYTEVDSEALAAADTRASAPTVVDAESFSVGEAGLRDVGVIDAEALALVDDLVSSVGYFKLLAEAVSVAEALAKLTTKPSSESFAIAEQRATDFTLPYAESLSLVDQIVSFKAFIVEAAEALGLTDVLAKIAERNGAELFSVSDARDGSAIETSYAEAVALSETYVDLIAFICSVLESATFNEVAGKDAIRGDAETFAAADANARDIGVEGSETLTLADQIASSAAFMQALAETLIAADILSNRPTKPASEAVALADASARSIGAFTTESTPIAELRGAAMMVPNAETFSASDASARDAGKLAFEDLEAADAHARTVTASQAETITAEDGLTSFIAYLNRIAELMAVVDTVSSATEQSLPELLALLDLRGSGFTVPLTEAFGIEEVRANNVSRRDVEAIDVAEDYIDLIAYLVNAAESLGIAEARLSVAQKAVAEAIGVADLAQRIATFLRAEADGLSATDAASAGVLASFGELIEPVEQLTRTATFDREFAEETSLNESYIDLIGFIVSAIESIGLAEARMGTVAQDMAESMPITEAQAKTLLKPLLETLAASESYIDLIGFINAASESIAVAEARRGTMTQRVSEPLPVVERLVRAINAVIAELTIRDSGLTLAQFETMLANRRPLGHYPPKALQPGDYRYQRAILRLLLEDRARTTREVAIPEATLLVDVPDITDRGTAVLTTAGLLILFGRGFYDAPEVQVMQTGGSTRSIPSVTTITETGFFVQLFDAASPTTPVAGTISWTALGK